MKRGDTPERTEEMFGISMSDHAHDAMNCPTPSSFLLVTSTVQNKVLRRYSSFLTWIAINKKKLTVTGRWVLFPCSAGHKRD